MVQCAVYITAEFYVCMLSGWLGCNLKGHWSMKFLFITLLWRNSLISLRLRSTVEWAICSESVLKRSWQYFSSTLSNLCTSANFCFFLFCFFKIAPSVYVFYLSRACIMQSNVLLMEMVTLWESDWSIQRDSFTHLQSVQSNLSSRCHQHSISLKISKSIKKRSLMV